MPQPGGPHDGAHVVPGVAERVVGQQRTDPDPEGAPPGQRACEERRGRGAVLLRQDFDVADARAVVDGDVHVLPADAARTPAEVAVDPVPDARDAAELLDVEVQEGAGAPALVAHHRSGRLEARELMEAEPPLDADHRREREAVVLRDAHRAPPAPPLAGDLAPLVARPPLWRARGP